MALRTARSGFRCLIVLTLLLGVAGLARAQTPVTVVGSESYAPLYFRDSSGQAAGVLVDLWKLWSEKTGEPVEFVNLPWSEGLDTVASRNDAVIAGFMHTAEREKRYDYSIPFYRISTHAFFHKSIEGVDDPALLSGFKVGVVVSDYAESFLAKNAPGAAVVTYPRYADLIQAAVDGEILVFVTDTPIALYLLRELGAYDQFHRANRPLYTSEIHAGVRQGEKELLQKIDEGLRAIGAEEINELEARWVGPPRTYDSALLLLGVVAMVALALWVGVYLWSISLRRKVREATERIERANARLEDHVNERTKELAQSESRMRAIIDAAPWGMHTYRLDNAGRLIFTGSNVSANGILKIDCSQFVGMTIEKAFPALEKTDIPDRYRAAADEGESWSSEQVEYNHGEISGAYKVEAFQTSPGEMAVAFQDVTEQRRREESLLQQAQMIDQVNGAVISANLEGEIRIWSKAAERLFGHTAEQAKGKALSVLYPDFEQEAVERRVIRPLMARGDHEVEINMTDQSGRVFPAYQSLSLMRDTMGVPMGVIVFSIDITKRRMAEHERDRLADQLRQSQKMEAVGTLAGGIAHDFNNLLHIISGYAEQLSLRGNNGAEESKHVDGILRAAERAGRLVRGLLTFSRKMDAQMVATDPGRLMELTLEILKRTLPKSVELHTDVPVSLPLILADEALLEQVLLNLVNNAVDAMPKGGKLTFRLRAPGHYGDAPPPPAGGLPYLLLTIADTGSGMDKDTLASMYEPFFSTKERGRGTGLGLSSVYGILREHEGHIRCQTDVGKGTSFHLYLPLADKEATVPPPEPKAAESDERPAALLASDHQTILVVDDEDDVRNLTSEALQAHGYRVLTAESGEIALAIYKDPDNAIDMTLLDLGMPGMGGAECLKQILATNPDALVLLATGYVPHGPSGPEIPTGAVGLLTKPYRIKSLLEEINQLLNP